MSNPHYEGVSKVVALNSIERTPCLECNELISNASFQEVINHYLEHGYKLLHIGTEGSTKGDHPFFETVAYLGR